MKWCLILYIFFVTSNGSTPVAVLPASSREACEEMANDVKRRYFVRYYGHMCVEVK
jgi:hypothetical protein